MVEVTTKAPRDTLSGGERIMAYDPSGATATDKFVLLERSTLQQIVNDLLTGSANRPL